HAAAPAPVAVTKLTCEYASDPLGIGAVPPRLGWVLESSRRGARQTAYQILAASSPERLAANRGDVWDSGKTAGDRSAQGPFSGPGLRSRQRVFWKVKVWDEAGLASSWSAPASFEMGLLDRADWRAQWISQPSLAEAPHLRKAFELQKPVRRARVYASARG